MNFSNFKFRKHWFIKLYKDKDTILVFCSMLFNFGGSLHMLDTNPLSDILCMNTTHILQQY